MPSEKMTCECGCSFVKSYLKRHLQTEKHTKRMKALEEQKEKKVEKKVEKKEPSNLRHLHAIKNEEIDLNLICKKMAYLMGEIKYQEVQLKKPENSREDMWATDEDIIDNIRELSRKYNYYVSIHNIVNKCYDKKKLKQVWYDSDEHRFKI